jgi:hypothetical protein
MPASNEMQEAQQYRIKGFQRLSYNGDDQRTDMLAMKQQLAQGSPVVIGMMVGGSYMQNMEGQDVWVPHAERLPHVGFRRPRTMRDRL